MVDSVMALYQPNSFLSYLSSSIGLNITSRCPLFGSAVALAVLRCDQHSALREKGHDSVARHKVRSCETVIYIRYCDVGH